LFIWVSKTTFAQIKIQMLQLQMIRQNPEWVKERLRIKNFINTDLVDEIIGCDIQRRKIQADLEIRQSEINSLSKKIGSFLQEGNKEEAELIKSGIPIIKESVEKLKRELEKLESHQQKLLLLLPNLPSKKVPVTIKAATGEIKVIGYPPDVIVTSLGNVVMREGGSKPNLPAGAVPHWDLIKKYGIVDFETGAKITGSGFPLYKGKGAKLQRALIQYFLDYNTAAGYTEYLPPFMVNEDTAYGTGQLPDKEGQMYYVPDDKFYLIPTSEVPLTNIYRDEILKETDLPIKMTAYSPCFRREAGSFGKDVRGLNRVHQFDKVEIVQLVHPEKSYEVLEEMVSHVEKLLQTLELPYRILNICGGDLGFASALTYDFEVYSAGQDKWLEVSSVSNFETFQTNRMKIRFKDANGKSQLVHSLNGSSLALPRIVACLLENNQTTDGIMLPVALHNYFSAKLIS
jgi:seryl-tRNA synthetase